MNHYFVTGTDTDVGKTFIIQYLLNYYKHAKYSVLGLKPISCGCKPINNQLCNDDALLLQQASSIQATYNIINPIALSAACSPHIAAQYENRQLTAKATAAAIQPGLQKNADYIFMEGAGGWFVPINQQQTMSDVAALLKLPVILVVGIRLGCLNHALLTQQAIANSGLQLAGWVANCIDPNHAFISDDIATLLDRIKAPLLLTMKYGGEVSFMNFP